MIHGQNLLPDALKGWILDEKINEWIGLLIDKCQPSSVHLCTGSESERKTLEKLCVDKGIFTPLNNQLFEHSFLARSNPLDVARVEEKTFICSSSQDDAGPTNHWKDPLEMKHHLDSIMQGCMRGRTMYIIPFAMGPVGAKQTRYGIEISDSPYVVLNMRIMTRMGSDIIEGNQSFVRCFHSVGVPLNNEIEDSPWPCDPERTVITHFPETREIFSFGSGYGGNALLGKKCFALRIASTIGKDEGWLAEHMLILGITNPEGKKKYIAASFPSACGKTNLAMLQSPFKGWKVECVGDDIAWMRFDSNGQLRAINPEAGFFGVAPGTSLKTNPNAMTSLKKNSIFTNVALTDDNGVWWEKMTEDSPSHLIDWKGREWTPSSSELAAHPNARFTAPASQCPSIDPNWEDPAGVPISAILFGGRRQSVIPLVHEAFSWNHGVFLGAMMSSEKTAAASGPLGKVRHDPFAMLPFCGYHMADYFSHWINLGDKNKDKNNLPKFYYVNWFQRDDDGNFLWPGFGENMRVLQWIFDRTEARGNEGAVESPIGMLPDIKDFNLEGSLVKESSLENLFTIDKKAWLEEMEEAKQYFSTFGSKFPEELKAQLESVKKRLVSMD